VKVAQPNKTFYDTGKLDSGVRYGYISDAAHTDGDIYVHFPNPNVLAVGGAVYGQGWADLDWWSGGWIGGMVGGLQRLQTVADANTRIIPAKGPVLGLADLKTQLDMYGTIYDRLSQLLNRGRSPKEAVEAKVTKEWDDKLGNSDAFVTRAFESLWAYVTPDA
jgi:glyoxylase-like metal-dependent hydrolase (beta-lactamase superfamily II)